MNERLPIAAGPEVRRDAAVLLRRYRRGRPRGRGRNPHAAGAGRFGAFVRGVGVAAGD